MKEDQTDRIEKYLREGITATEKEAFEKDMESDPKLREETEQMRQIIKGITIHFNKRLKSRLQHEELVSKEDGKKTFFIGLVASVAAVVLLFAILYIYVFLPDPDLKNLFITYYKPYPNIEEPISRSDAEGVSAYTLYESGRYSDALKEFQKILKQDRSEVSALFYAGISSLETEKPEDAIRYLSKVLEMGEGKYIRPAMWYLALSYLATEDRENAVKYLNNLLIEDDLYARKATGVLRKFK
jgi:cytochrome c-type biogenesis protein CcmH/NrfG